MPLHDFQQAAHEKAVAILRSGGKRGYSAPTGSGKSFVLAANHAALRPEGLVTVFPTTEIGLGVWRRLPHVSTYDYSVLLTQSEAHQQRTLEAEGLWTVMRYYNALLAGDAELAKSLQFDEGHHTTADTYQSIHAFCGDCPAVMYTATGFRGTPEETAKLKAKWGDIEPILTLGEAVNRGIISRPDFRVWPLMNDDTIKVTNGEFETKAVEKDLARVIPALCERIVEEFCTPGNNGDQYGAFWSEPSRPTMVTAPGVVSAHSIGEALAAVGVPAVVVTGSDCVYLPASASDRTPDRLTRQAAFAKVVACECILVQVNVVSEGVDLPIRVQIDTAPCMSPVRWQQRVGRGTRPVKAGDAPPVYVCTNHNLSRHAYLWAGLIPAAQVRAAQKAWGEDYVPSRRTFARALGLEGFGKFKAAKIPMLDGSYSGLYALQTKDGLHQYAVLLHPCRPEPLFFQRTNVHNGEYGEHKLDNGQVVRYKLKDYGKWKRIPTIPNADGYVSVKPQAVRERAIDWWQGRLGRGAEWCGLDPEHVPNAHEFQILPALLHTGIRFKVEEV